MEKPDVIATHFPTSSAPDVWANIGLAKTSKASASKNSFGFIVVLLLL
jgi:hypothetical protein